MSTITRPKVIGIILAYRHAPFLEELYRTLPLDLLDAVIVANDESGDNIEEVAERLGIPCFSHPRLGYGGNMKFGLKKALAMGADYMVEIHGDGQYDPAFIKPAVKKMKQGYDLVLGTRFMDRRQPLRDHMPLVKYVANIGLTCIEALVLGVRVSEFHTGARVYSRKAIQAIDLTHTSNNFLFGFEIIVQIAYHNFKIGEVPGRAYYGKTHTTIDMPSSILYAIGSFGVLFAYMAARMGYKTKLFN